MADVGGSGGAVEFWQSGPIGVNVGVTWALTVTLIVAVVAHVLPLGVNVYVVVPVVDVLIDDGLHVPAIPLADVGGSGGAVEF